MNQVEKAPGKNFNLWIVAIVGIFVGILLMVGGTKTDVIAQPLVSFYPLIKNHTPHLSSPEYSHKPRLI